MGAIFQSPSLISRVSGRKSGISPALILSCRSARLAMRSSTLPLYSRESFATKATASGVSILPSHGPERSEPETSSGRRPGLPTDLPDDPVHIDDARGRHTTPPVENAILVETYPHPRPDGRRALLVTALQYLLRLRVPVLYRNHRSLLSTSPS